MWRTSLSTDTSGIHLPTQKCMQNTSWESTGVPDQRKRIYRTMQNSLKHLDNSLLNNCQQENVGSHQKKDTPHPRAKEKPQKDGSRGETAFRIKPCTRQRRLEGSKKPCVHHDPEFPQRQSRNCVWVYPVEVQVSSRLPQGRGYGCSRFGCWHKPSWRRSPLSPP